MRFLYIGIYRFIFSVSLIFAPLYPLLSQVTPSPADTVSLPGRTLEGQRDTLLAVQDTLKSDSTHRVKKGDIESTVNYSAKDSIHASLDGQKIWLYGEAKAQYGEIELEAEEIIVDYVHKTLTAHGHRDSTGQRIGYPVFKDGPEVYETKDIVYNFETKKARISEVVTKQGDGFLHGDVVFKNDKNEVFSIRNTYTTCDLEHPHFRIRSTRTKAIPKDKIVSGPFYFEFNDIPLPVGFLFGMFPAERESMSGILFPSYGEERIRGFNLRGGGYFFDISEYMKLAVTADVYSKGGHALYLLSNYSKRYRYNGNFNFTYSKNRNGDRIEDRDFSNDFRLAWSHSPQSKGTGRFSASVNAATSTFNKNNNLIYGNTDMVNSTAMSGITTKMSSNISYSKRFTGTPFSMGINLSHNQDLRTKVVDLPLPNLTLNMTNLYPFQRKGKTGPLDNFMFGYSMTGTNRITNNLGRLPGALKDSIAPFNFENLPVFMRNARNGIHHIIPISYSFKALKHFTISPSVNYDEKWYFEQLSWRFLNDGTQEYLKADTAKGFNRVANYSVSAGINTRMYGFYFFKKGSVKAIRHVINPNVSFSYTPDFSTNQQYFQKMTDAKGFVQYKSRHEGFVYGASNIGKSGAIGFGLGNNLEMKVKTAKDTVDRKVMLLNNFSISSSYNLVADSFKLAPFNMAANTNILNNLININLSGTLDPYARFYTTDENGKVRERKVDRYAWNYGSLGRIVNATLAMNTNLNPKGREKEKKTREKVANSNLPEQEKQHIIQNPNAYVDFDIPWSLNINYSLTYNRTDNQPVRIIQALQCSGDISLSKNWKTHFNTGFDFERKEITQTDLGISRDIHCWTMRLWWVPFGRFQSYNFTIAVKSALLKDLKLERRKPFFDNL